jgi:hypothetical protein
MSKNVLLRSIGAAVALGWLVIIAVHPSGSLSWAFFLAIGALLGTMFGQTSLSAAWCALGPWSLIQRLPLASAWMAAIILSLCVNLALTRSGDGLAVVLVYGGVMVLQWLLVQAPLWLFAAMYGVRVVHADTDACSARHNNHQFGIRQVLILTTLVALVLGASKMMLGDLKSVNFGGERGFLVFLVILEVANSLMAVLIVSASFLLRSQHAILVVAIVIAGAAAAETPLMEWLEPGPAGMSNFWILLPLNAVHCGWILIVIMLLRAGGFRMMSRGAAASVAPSPAAPG